MINIGPLEFFPPQALRTFTSLGTRRLYALVAAYSPSPLGEGRGEGPGRGEGEAPEVVYLGKSLELNYGGIGRTHQAVQRWRCLGRDTAELMACESAQDFSDAELVAIEARLVARFRPLLNGEPAANEAKPWPDPEPWWSGYFSFTRNNPEGSL